MRTENRVVNYMSVHVDEREKWLTKCYEQLVLGSFSF